MNVALIFLFCLYYFIGPLLKWMNGQCSILYGQSGKCGRYRSWEVIVPSKDTL